MNRYGMGFYETGDVLDMSLWVQDMALLAGEINGGLDRDNLPAATITAGEVTATTGHAFNAQYNSPTETAFSEVITSTDWQSGTGTSTGANNLGISTWVSTQDGHLDIAWSGEWHWTGAYSLVAAGAAKPDYTDTLDTIAFRITVDGVVVAQSQPFDDSAVDWATDLEADRMRTAVSELEAASVADRATAPVASSVSSP